MNSTSTSTTMELPVAATGLGGITLVLLLQCLQFVLKIIKHIRSIKINKDGVDIQSAPSSPPTDAAQDPDINKLAAA